MGALNKEKIVGRSGVEIINWESRPNGKEQAIIHYSNSVGERRKERHLVFHFPQQNNTHTRRVCQPHSPVGEVGEGHVFRPGSI